MMGFGWRDWAKATATAIVIVAVGYPVLVVWLVLVGAGQ